ncbi:hypothetical protein B6228_04270, partial [Candidatus Atribacteria bacterium 4572_76]
MKLYEKWNKWKSRDKISGKNMQKKKLIDKNIIQKISIFFVLLTTITLVLSINFFPDKILLKESQICTKDILSPGDFEFVDVEATQNLREKAAKSIKEVYDLNLANIENVEKQIDNLFSKIKEYQEKANESSKDTTSPITENDRRLTDNELNKMANEINEDLGLSISEKVIAGCLQLDNLSLEKIRVDIKSSMRKIMEQGIKEDDLENAKKQLIREISEISLDHHDALIASEIATSLLLPSLFLNEEDTEKRRQEAIASVDDVIRTIRKGQIIIRKGEVISSEDIAILNALGLKNPKINFFNIVGIIMIAAICILVVFLYLNYFYPEIYENVNKLILLGIIAIFVVLLAKIASQASGYLMPIASASMLIAISLNPNIAILLTVILSLLIGFIPGGGINYILVSVISGIVAIYSIRKITQRSSLTRAGLIIAGVN